MISADTEICDTMYLKVVFTKDVWVVLGRETIVGWQEVLVEVNVT